MEVGQNGANGTFVQKIVAVGHKKEDGRAPIHHLGTAEMTVKERKRKVRYAILRDAQVRLR